MSDINVQIKQKIGDTWDNLYPKTKAEIVVTTTEKQFVTETEKTAWNSKQAALGFTPENTANKNKANGYVGLDANSKIPDAYIPKIAISDTFTVDSQSAMLALTAEVGDICIRTDLSKTYILHALPSSTLANWKEILSPTQNVTSVNGKTGVVIINKSDVGLSEGRNIITSTTEPTTMTDGDIWISII